MSVWAGVDLLIDDWLQVERAGQPPYFRHRTAAIELTRRSQPIFGAEAFLEEAYAQIDRNWLDARKAGTSVPSRENWRWKRHISVSPHNTSAEVRLERAIVDACGESWSNQMPVASGLVDGIHDKHADVDLVYRANETTFELVELKTESNNPLYAAMQILKYGLVLLWSKSNLQALAYNVDERPVLGASDVTLSVLAPAEYYGGLDLANLCAEINAGLEQIGSKRGLQLRFEFSQFPEDVHPDMPSQELESAFVRRSPIWSSWTTRRP